MCRHNCNMQQAQCFVSELLTSIDGRRKHHTFSQPTRLYRCDRNVSVLINITSIKFLSCSLSVAQSASNVTDNACKLQT